MNGWAAKMDAFLPDVLLDIESELTNVDDFAKLLQGFYFCFSFSNGKHQGSKRASLLSTGMPLSKIIES